jgi:outer membrane protein assembly factor BamB
VYIVTENAGAGLTCLDSTTGARLWATHPPGQVFEERGQWGADIAFGPATSGGEPNQVYVAFDMRPLQVPIPQGANSALFAFGTGGSHRWSAAVGGQSIAGGQQQGEAAVGLDGTVYECNLFPPNAWALYAHDPANGSTKWGLYLPPGNVISEPTVSQDGTVYMVRNTVHIHAVRPNGTVEWTYTDPAGSLYEAAVESPDGRVVISAGSIGDTLTFSGHVRAVSGAGQNLWSHFLAREGANPIVPRTRAFYSADSRRAYLGTSGSQTLGEEYAYLIALDTAPPRQTSCDGDFDGDGDFGTDQDIEAFFACLAGHCCTACLTADFNGDGDFGTDQDIEAFFRVLAGGGC